MQMQSIMQFAKHGQWLCMMYAEQSVKRLERGKQNDENCIYFPGTRFTISWNGKRTCGQLMKKVSIILMNADRVLGFSFE